MEYKDSKSFLATLVLIIRCDLYPGAKLFVTSGGKEQSAGIIKEKVQEICSLIPAFHRELNWARGVTLLRNHKCKYIFKNAFYLKKKEKKNQ